MAEQEAHAGWGSSFVDAARVVEGVKAQGDSRNCAGETDEKRTLVNKTCPFSAASGKPGRADQVEGANAAGDVALLGRMARQKALVARVSMATVKTLPDAR